MEQLARSKEEAQQNADAARIGKRQAEETARQTLEQATSEAAAQAVSRMEKKMAQATQREIAAAVAAALKEHETLGSTDDMHSTTISPISTTQKPWHWKKSAS